MDSASSLKSEATGLAPLLAGVQFPSLPISMYLTDKPA